MRFSLLFINDGDFYSMILIQFDDRTICVRVPIYIISYRNFSFFCSCVTMYVLKLCYRFNPTTPTPIATVHKGIGEKEATPQVPLAHSHSSDAHTESAAAFGLVDWRFFPLLFIIIICFSTSFALVDLHCRVLRH